MDGFSRNLENRKTADRRMADYIQEG